MTVEGSSDLRARLAGWADSARSTLGPDGPPWLRDLPFYLMALGFAGFLLHRVCALGLARWDESHYVLNAYEMMKGGDWIGLRFSGELDRANLRPPLNAWMLALLFRAFGYSDLVARLPSIAAGLGTAVLVYHFVRRVTRDPLAAAISGMGLATCTGFYGYHGMTSADPDIPALFFATLSLGSIHRAAVEVEGETRWWLGVGAFSGLGFLTISWLGLAPACLAVPAVALARGPKALLDRHLPMAALLLLALTVPWVLLREHRFPDSYLGDFLADALRRLRTPNESGTEALDCLASLRDYLGPWRWMAGFSAAAVLNAWVVSPSADERRALTGGSPFRAAALSAGTVLFYFLIFSARRAQMNWFVFAGYPALFMLVGIGFGRFLEPVSRWLRYPLLLLLLAKNLVDLEGYDQRRLSQSPFTGVALDRVIRPMPAEVWQSKIIVYGIPWQNEWATLQVLSGLNATAYQADIPLASVLAARPDAQFLYMVDARPYVKDGRSTAPELHGIRVMTSAPGQSAPAFFQILRPAPTAQPAKPAQKRDP